MAFAGNLVIREIAKRPILWVHPAVSHAYDQGFAKAQYNIGFMTMRQVSMLNARFLAGMKATDELRAWVCELLRRKAIRGWLGECVAFPERAWSINAS